MNSLVEAKRDAVIDLCQRHHVRRLALFGSAAGDGFEDGRSDVDFLVEFEPCEPNDHYEYYFGLLESLEVLLGRPIDLVETRAMKNPYFIRSVNETRTEIYAA